VPGAPGIAEAQEGLSRVTPTARTAEAMHSTQGTERPGKGETIR